MLAQSQYYHDHRSYGIHLSRIMHLYKAQTANKHCKNNGLTFLLYITDHFKIFQYNYIPFIWTALVSFLTYC